MEFFSKEICLSWSINNFLPVPRMSLEDARARLAESSLGMLSAVKRRQRIQKLLQNLTIIATLVRKNIQQTNLI